MDERKMDKLTDFKWEIKADPERGMKVPVRIYANDKVAELMQRDRTLSQATNAATMPSMVENMLVMPDGHEGYGFPIGGVAAFDADNGVISPGAVGFDINCLHPDTKVMDGNGGWVKISQLSPGQELLTYNYNTSQLIKSRSILVMRRMEEQPLFKITTESGRKILTTADHPILTKSGMVLTKHVTVESTLITDEDEKDTHEQVIPYPDKISTIDRLNYKGNVYDLMVNNPYHNFMANGIVVSNCGVRLIKTNLTAKELAPNVPRLMDAMFKNVPSGVGSKLNVGFTEKDIDKVAMEGASYVVSKGYGFKDDIEFIEEGGGMDGADTGKVSPLAKQRGKPQLGTLGAGNHFAEVQRVEKVLDEKMAKAYGLFEDQVVIMLHSGSRGYGHQVCSDYLRVLVDYEKNNNIRFPDPELSYAFIGSKEANDYLGAMKAAVNFAFANRQMMTHFIRKSFEEALGKSADALGMQILYDLSHNIAKLEEHTVNGKRMKVYVHRKGATRAFAPGRKEIPKAYRDVGQPVLIPGSMGTASYVLAGREGSMLETFGSSCHGAGRVMSRHQAIRDIPAKKTLDEMERKHIAIRVRSHKLISEEAEWAYKDVDDVVASIEGANISKAVTRLTPIGVTKG